MNQIIPTQNAASAGTLRLLMAEQRIEIGRRIAAAREAKGWTQLEFALQANISPSSVSRWERGQLPPVRELTRIAGVLQVEPSDLVAEPAEPSDDVMAMLRLLLAEVRSVKKSVRALSP